jgi:hypothetical protein
MHNRSTKGHAARAGLRPTPYALINSFKRFRDVLPPSSGSNNKQIKQVTIMNISIFLDKTTCNPPKSQPTFRRNMNIRDLICYLLHAGFFLGLFFYLNDGSDMFLLNADTYLINYTASSNTLVQAMILLTCIRKVPVPNLGRDRNYHAWIFSFSISRKIGKYQDSTLN